MGYNHRQRQGNKPDIKFPPIKKAAADATKTDKRIPIDTIRLNKSMDSDMDIFDRSIKGGSTIETDNETVVYSPVAGRAIDRFMSRQDTLRRTRKGIIPAKP